MSKQYVANDALFTFLFGFSSIVLSEVQFQIPDMGGSNLREIPLLICIFHVRNPLFLFLLSVFTLYSPPPGIPLWAVYGVHLIPLLVVDSAFKKLDRSSLSASVKGIAWMLITAGYYFLLLLPLVVITLLSFDAVKKSFWVVYKSILPPIGFEVVASVLVTGLYLMQWEIRKTLRSQNRNLEQVVAQRTRELTQANNELQTVNEELTASNEGIKGLNENLERLVEERTDKINSQLEQLRRYAYMNSHELRAPFARMLGLLQLLKLEKNPEQMKTLLNYLQESSTELDNVIRQMNRLLEKEIVIDNDESPSA